ELIVASDRPTAPVTIGLVAATNVRLDPRRLDAAVAAAVTAHPVVAARLTVGTVGATWLTPRHARIDVVEVDCDSEAAVWDSLARACSYSFTPDSRNQLRVVLARRAGGDSLVLGAHHAAMDGASLTTLLRLIMQCYEGSCPTGPADGSSTAGTSASRPPVSRPAPASPVNASEHPTPAATRPGPVARRRRLPTVATRIAPDRSNGPIVTWIRRHLVTLPVDDCYGVHGVSIDVPGLGLLPDGTKPTVNDALVAATHLAVDRWNSARRQPAATVVTRTGTNLRTASELSVVANLSGEILVATKAEDRTEPT
nr:hypothetical protein [Micromonospora sp. DSM 115978]